ncbi:homologous-pairing protein 2 homolog [Vespa velutina]|uniref:homologous-pairing protein 2 homolog n=1 Tax=Vespa velutina TaxID=202808 RepID=UPI001FB46615|nr:homologous-pairing protein 2 homolog [Vespa velutina]XP_047370049.1 homologous-pairing protein 2 homolog [Vespa velutina]XP_047370050.1 homologous-pairing protein 2 homolog [Vespa velutina]XP_047370051.1 homologous-pairing protein 2 homolog [Vespa velutina]XP_047370053.1 homologous-pairing protein 2 homolog [Vespa velutina]XP_047370054.1 homologous-pairing protein 2 homolog [Vespa velutina]XP_047370055.1 homologous-pairing protein 2 homolog [Vespa velutina]
MAMDTVYKHLKIQNRPYSVNDIVLNLHNEFGKSAVQKAIDHLLTEGKIFEKVYGKQKVYCVVQDSTQDIEELMRIDKELQAHANDVETRYQDLEKEIKNQETLLKSLKSSVTVEEAYKEKVLLLESINVLTNKLDKLIESTGSMDLTEIKRKTQSSLDEYTREYVKRKRLCTDIIDCILENYPGTKSELYDEIGIDPKIIN